MKTYDKYSYKFLLEEIAVLEQSGSFDDITKAHDIKRYLRNIKNYENDCLLKNTNIDALIEKFKLEEEQNKRLFS